MAKHTITKAMVEAAAAATAAAAAAKPTAGEALAEFRQNVARMMESAAYDLKQTVQAKADAYAEMAAAEDPRALARAFLFAGNWNMTKGAYESGKIGVYDSVLRHLDRLTGEGRTPADVADALHEELHSAMLNDSTRYENSTDPISNAVTMHAGGGRGEAYRVVSALICGLRKQLAKVAG